MDTTAVDAVLCLVSGEIGRLTAYLERAEVIERAITVAKRDPEYRARIGVVAHKLAQIVREASGGKTPPAG